MVYGILVMLILLEPIISRLFSKEKYLFFCFIGLSFILGLSSEYIGLNDRELVYSRVFNIIVETNSFEECISIMTSRVSNGYGFYILTWIVTRFIKNYNIYLLLLSIPINLSIIRFIKRYSSDVMLSILIYVSLIYPLFFTIVRQALAIAILLYAVDFLNEKKYIRFSILVLLCSTIHITATIFMLFVLFSIFTYKRIYLIFIAMVFVLETIGNGVVLRIVATFFSIDKYQKNYVNGNSSPGLSITAVAIRACIFILVYIFYQYWGCNKRNNQSVDESCIYIPNNIITSSSFLVWNAEMAVICSLLISTLGEFQRLIAYFEVFSMLSIPLALRIFKSGNSRKIARLIIVTFLIVYFLGFQLDNWGIQEYKFYFNDYI